MKMKKKILINPITIKKFPFFKSGSVVFADSGHELEESSKHYRCKKHCKSGSGEMQIKKENLQKNFQYFAEKFCIDQKKGIAIGERLLDKYLIKLLIGIGYPSGKQEILDSTVTVMSEDLKNIKSIKAEDEYRKTGKFKGGGKIKKEDVKDFKDAYVGFQKDIQPIHLFSVLLSYTKTLSDPRYRKYLGRGLALIAKKIFISNDGKIVKVEFERWGWYVLSYINEQVPSYLFNLKQRGVKITNGDDEVLGLDIEEAINYFKDTNFLDAMHWFDVKVLYDLFNIPQKMMQAMKGGPQDVQKATIEFLEFMNDNPLALFAANFFPAVGKAIKVKKK